MIPQSGPEAIVFILFCLSFGVGFLTGASIASLLWLLIKLK